MTEKRNIEAVVFDVDGTLYPNYKMYINSVLFFFRNPVLALAFRKIRKKIRKSGYSGNFRKKQAELLSEEMNISYQRASQLLEEKIYKDFISMFRWIKPYPVLQEVLGEMKENRIKLGVISDFPVKEKLSYLGLDRYWDEVCSADELGYLKPKPQAFAVMAEKLGIRPEKIIYVGNHYLYDIMGANNAGMLSAHFSCRKKSSSKADFTFNNYRKLRNFVLGSSKS